MDRVFWSRKKLMPRITKADSRGTDELWDEAIEALARKPDVDEPFAYFTATLERLVEASVREYHPGGEVVAPRVLVASGPGPGPTREELMARWLDLGDGVDQGGGDK